MIFSIYREKAFGKIQYPFMIKTAESSTAGTYFNIIKALYDKSRANIILSSEKVKAFTQRSRKRQVFPLFDTLTQHNFGSPIHSNQRRRNKRNPDQKRSKALTVCR